MRKLFTLSFICLLFACKDTKPEPETGIIGKWRLRSYCRPTGDNVCTNTSMPSNKIVYIEFSSNGNFNETYQNTIPVEYAFLGCGSGDYKLENEDVRIHAMCMSSTTGRLIKIKSVNDTQLVLIPFETGEYIFSRE